MKREIDAFIAGLAVATAIAIVLIVMLHGGLGR